MIEIKYVCSNGKEYNLIGNRMRPTSGYFHEYEWEPSVTENTIGVDVYGFEKSPKTYKITLTIRGKLEERKNLLDELTNCWEYDVANLTPGKIYFGKYYINCYIKEMTNKVSDTRNNWTDCEISIYCPYPMWVEELSKSFYAASENSESEYEYLDYQYDYKYDYSKPATGAETWNIEHYRKSNFKMIIYGPCVDPKIMIADQEYQVFDTLEANEHIVVDSRHKKVMKYKTDGTEENIFYKKSTQSSIFTEIPEGELLVSWDGTFGFDITVFKERSVPEWS